MNKHLRQPCTGDPSGPLDTQRLTRLNIITSKMFRCETWSGGNDWILHFAHGGKTAPVLMLTNKIKIHFYSKWSSGDFQWNGAQMIPVHLQSHSSVETQVHMLLWEEGLWPMQHTRSFSTSLSLLCLLSANILSVYIKPHSDNSIVIY